MLITRFSITKNNNIRKHRADRKAVRFTNFKSYSYVAEGIILMDFEVDGKLVQFLDDTTNAKWLVSECDDYIVGSGVLNKIYKL